MGRPDGSDVTGIAVYGLPFQPPRWQEFPHRIISRFQH
jgi:hypothetical protein